MSTERQREDNLNESWVEVGSGNQNTANSSPVPLRTTKDVMEKLLLEAQKESSSTSHADSQASSKSSSNGDRAANSSPQADVESLADLKEKDWIWDWSSRPEICPPSDTVVRLKHPGEGSSQRCRLSIRNTWIMRSLLFSMENLPLLIVTHAFSFILGATTMFVCLRRYGSSWVSSAIYTT